jgi:decaprenylphospho-beta-D-erythro-pentofuranosid-2-ulose 2-reductase
MGCMLVLGATSDIARAVARRFAAEGWGLILAARNPHLLERLSRDIQVRYGNKVVSVLFDVLDMDSHKRFWENLPERPDAVFCAVGYLGDQKLAEKDAAEVQRIVLTNYLGILSLLNLAATEFETNRKGCIIGVSSVAGERGRQSNYFYGSAKAGFTAYLSGLRNRLFPAQVQVLTVHPGFVLTAMTQNMKLPAILTAHPDEVAEDILLAVNKGRDVIYTKWFWRYIMCLIRLIPEKLFKRLTL